MGAPTKANYALTESLTQCLEACVCHMSCCRTLLENVVRVFLLLAPHNRKITRHKLVKFCMDVMPYYTSQIRTLRNLALCNTIVAGAQFREVGL
jgi:hypothetical protein